MLKKIFALCVISIITCNVFSQTISDSSFQYQHSDSISFQKNITVINPRPRLKGLIIPAMMIGYGFSSLHSDGLKDINSEIKEELYLEHPHKKEHIDNYLQFAPAAAVYGLNMLGIKGKNNLRDRSLIFLTSNIIVNSTVFSLKNITKQMRPDGSARSSFPSGHTAEAFANAEFLRQEYKDVSPWYGVAGYAVAATTGYLRMYNNKHWLSDVVAGAGIGIASTKIAYWLYPKIRSKFGKKSSGNNLIMPSVSNKGAGFTFVHRFT